jgi:uncharacterized phage protein (TIGR02220 family)
MSRELSIKDLRSQAANKRWCKDDANTMQPPPPAADAKGHAPSASASDGVGERGEGEGGKFITEARVVIHFLNETVRRSFRETESNLTSIRARFQEGGVDLDGVKKMILRQKALWSEDPKMSEYLRIETLFAKSKFDSYYAAKDLPARVQNSGNAGASGVDRNRGTTNARTIGQYDGVGKVV